MKNEDEKFTLDEFEDLCRGLAIVEISFHTNGRAVGSMKTKVTLTSDIGVKTPYGVEYCFVHSTAPNLLEAIAGIEQERLRVSRDETAGEDYEDQD